MSLVHTAILEGKLDVIRRIVDKDALNEQDASGKTSLHLAVLSARVLAPETARSIVTHLCCYQASLTLQDKDGRTPLHVACRYAEHPTIFKYILPLLIEAAKGQSFDMKCKDLRDRTVLHYAALYENPNAKDAEDTHIMQFIRKVPDLDLNTCTTQGNSLIVYAYIGKNKLAIEAMLAHGICLSKYDTQLLKRVIEDAFKIEGR